MNEALELRREHKEDEQQRHEEQEIQPAARFGVFAHLAVEFREDAGWQRALRDGPEVPRRLPDRDPGRQIGVERRRAHAIEMVELAWRYALVDVHDVRELDESAPTANVDSVDHRGRGAVARRYLQHDVVLPVAELEVGH